MQKSLLFIPGPVAVSEPVLAAMAKPLINHRGPEYARLLHSIAERMQSIFATTGDVLLLGASGTGSLEAAVTNMFGPGDTLLACPTGVFGERIATIAKMWGCTVEMLETPWGAGVDPEALAARLRADREKKITGILLTHNETSTAVQIDLGAMSRAIADHPAYVVVDSVSGLGASEFKMDEWKLDIVCAASQKALACPPGLAMVAVSPREEDKGERGAALLLRFTEAQGVFRQGRAALDAAAFGRFCTRRRDRPLRKGRAPERLGASRTLHRRASSSY